MKIVNGRTLVPVRFIADCFGVGVDWDGNTRKVILTLNK
ncbi:MAG: copper amine oxidase N-terminal domain-containing protein [Ruminococcaceae bacterium]|nr:copper amine oxidase N-terminal domain-containing protein [Oscillospiraceae bacterium]